MLVVLADTLLNFSNAGTVFRLCQLILQFAGAFGCLPGLANGFVHIVLFAANQEVLFVLSRLQQVSLNGGRVGDNACPVAELIQGDIAGGAHQNGQQDQ